jgi:predicted Zn-dependent protease
MRFTRLFISTLLSVSLFVTQSSLPVWAKDKARQGPNLIRDAEIEGFLRHISKPIFKAANLNPSAIKVYLIADPTINAFVAGGQRIFIHTGLITRSETPNEVIGVLAHETGHIAGGHLAKMNSELASANVQSIVGMLVGAAAIVGGAMAGSSSAAQAGTGVLMGATGIGNRSFLQYQRGMESTADQSALKYLNATGQSPKGMLTLFNVLANESLATAVRADPYVYSHPMPFDRINTLEKAAKASPYFDKVDDADLVLRFELAKAKLAGFLDSPQSVFQHYPSKDVSLPARYARAIAMFRRGDIKNATPIISSLTDEVPQDPYFWELKAQAYLENGNPVAGIPAIRKARSLLPNNGLLQLLEAQILVSTDDAKYADAALSALSKAKQTEGDTPELYKLTARAYGLKNDVPRAELATAEFALMTGDRNMAVTKATSVQNFFKKNSHEWLRASDILNYTKKKK